MTRFAGDTIGIKSLSELSADKGSELSDLARRLTVLEQGGAVNPDESKRYEERNAIRDLYAAQIAEGHDILTAMRYNPAATPEDWERYSFAFEEVDPPAFGKGGGSKQARAGQAANRAKARARANKRGREGGKPSRSQKAGAKRRGG